MVLGNQPLTGLKSSSQASIMRPTVLADTQYCSPRSFCEIFLDKLSVTACFTLLAMRQPALIPIIGAILVTVWGQIADDGQIYFCFLISSTVGTLAIGNPCIFTGRFRKPFFNIGRPHTGH